MSAPTRRSRVHRRAAPWLLGVGLVAGACSAGIASRAWSQELAASPTAPREPVVNLGEMVYVASRGDVNEVVLDADTARILPEQHVAYLEVVSAKLASAEGAGALDMTCDSGTFELDSGDFIAEGNVRGVTGDGRRFQTTRLRYAHDRALVSTDEPVVIRDATGTYRGGGFRYHVRENRFRLMGGATVVQDG